MATDPRDDPREQNWRLQVELPVDEPRGALERLLGSLRSPALVKEVQASVPHDVVITHDGKMLFAYASDEATLQMTRQAVEGVLGRDGITAKSIRLASG